MKPFHLMSTSKRAYELALNDCLTPGSYWYFIPVLEQLNTIYQCYAYLNIVEGSLGNVQNHRPYSYILNIRLARRDLIWQRIFLIRSGLL